MSIFTTYFWSQTCYIVPQDIMLMKVFFSWRKRVTFFTPELGVFRKGISIITRDGGMARYIISYHPAHESVKRLRYVYSYFKSLFNLYYLCFMNSCHFLLPSGQSLPSTVAWLHRLQTLEYILFFGGLQRKPVMSFPVSNRRYTP